ncbi:MAG: hypothetical protein ACUVXD_19430 [Thermodesulfobacteriota bacterium]
MDGLRDALDRETVVRWLRNFGPQGEVLAPLVAGDLYALLDGELSRVLEKHPGWTHEELMASLRNPFGYSDGDARRLIARASPSLGIPLEEAVRACLRHAGDRRS